ncbi:MAG TPA: rRNA maturation RNase YbeY [Pseudobdellovibrionaceae bacterium]|nr:rRNA maturation RNase YbeY [Pseudobdellovibrionaceae bacterium]
MNLLLINDSGETLNEDFLGKWVKAVSEELLKRRILPPEKEVLELSVVFLKENDAKQLNWNYRQKDYATDVLSFETDDPGSLGELVLCAPVLQRQAVEHKLSFEHETGYMILHGVLHLLGYDHEKDEDEAEAMLSLQDEVFALLTKPPSSKKTPSNGRPSLKKASANKAANKMSAVTSKAKSSRTKESAKSAVKKSAAVTKTKSASKARSGASKKTKKG